MEKLKRGGKELEEVVDERHNRGRKWGKGRGKKKTVRSRWYWSGPVLVLVVPGAGWRRVSGHGHLRWCSLIVRSGWGTPSPTFCSSQPSRLSSAPSSTSGCTRLGRRVAAPVLSQEGGEEAGGWCAAGLGRWGKLLTLITVTLHHCKCRQRLLRQAKQCGEHREHRSACRQPEQPHVVLAGGWRAALRPPGSQASLCAIAPTSLLSGVMSPFNPPKAGEDIGPL